MKRRLSDSIFALSEIECRLSASNSREAVAASMISFFWRSAFSCRFRSKASMLLSESARVTKGSFSFSSGLGSILPESSEQGGGAPNRGRGGGTPGSYGARESQPPSRARLSPGDTIPGWHSDTVRPVSSHLDVGPPRTASSSVNGVKAKPTL